MFNFKPRFEHPPLVQAMLERMMRKGMPPKRLELQPKIKPMEAGPRMPSLMKGL
jgi:hypothetical protein